LYSKTDCTDPCDTAQIGSLTPHMRKQQQHSSSHWHIVWTGINQKQQQHSSSHWHIVWTGINQKQQQHSSSHWHIVWTGINQNFYRLQWDRHGRTVHNVVPNNDGSHKISSWAADTCMSCTNSDTLVHRMTSCAEANDTRIYIQAWLAMIPSIFLVSG